jgi:hypothetical protein
VVKVHHLPATLIDHVVMRLICHDLILCMAPAQVGLAEDAQVALAHRMQEVNETAEREREDSI